ERRANLRLLIRMTPPVRKRAGAQALDPTTVDALPDQIAVIDRDGVIVWVNEAWTDFARSAGASDEVCQGVGTHYLDECRRVAAQGSAEAAQSLAAIESVLNGEQARASARYSCRTSEWRRSFELTASGLGLGNGAILVHHDVSATDDAEEHGGVASDAAAASTGWPVGGAAELPSFGRHDNALLDAIPDLMFEVDSDARILSFRPARDFDPYLPPAEFLGRRVTDVLPSPVGDRLADAIAAAFDTGVIQVVAYQLEVADEARDYEARVIRATESVAFGIVRDYTTQRREQLETDRRREVEELEGLVERQLLRRNPYHLTFRELTVLNLVAAGLADKAIAERLVLSTYTVNKHVAHILAKMGVQSRTQAAMQAQRDGLLAVDPD
nr:LuxR C-terminal-related transcriptional regulator [Dehalococcoidia bacterium]